MLSVDCRNNTEPVLLGGFWSSKNCTLVELLVEHEELARRLFGNMQEENVICQSLGTFITEHLKHTRERDGTKTKKEGCDGWQTETK